MLKFMDIMTSFIARREPRIDEKKVQLRTYLVRKRKRLSGIIYRSQNRHLRPFYHAGEIKIQYSDKLNVLKEVFKKFSEGEYNILYYPLRKKGFRLFWKGRLPTERIIEMMKEDGD